MTRTRPTSELIENLEKRLLFAVTPLDTLLVRGTDSGDFITLEVRNADTATPTLRTIINGRVRNFSLVGKTNIVVEARNGNDQIFVNKNTVRGFLINGGLGDDSILGGKGNDRIIGGRGRDTIQGNDGNDVLRGDDDNDLVNGLNGNDRIDGGRGNDFLTGGNGNDTMIGGLGADQIYGQDGNDVFRAFDGEMDTISGGDGTNNAETIDPIDAAAQI